MSHDALKNEQLRPAVAAEEPIAPAPARPLFGPAVLRPRRGIRLVRVIMILLAGALLTLGGAVGWLSWREMAARAAQAQTRLLPCSRGFRLYENKSLDLAFCYPPAWGGVAVTDARYAAEDTGRRWRLSFSGMRQLHVSTVTTNWTTLSPPTGACTDAAVQSIQMVPTFSTDWQSTSQPVANARRGITMAKNKYLIEERVDQPIDNGVCLGGYVAREGPYPYVAATYRATFAGQIGSPDQHIARPEVLIPPTDRADFTAFVQSIRRPHK
jgi:hypothetical protein